MQDATLSPWFNLSEQRPWRVGVYEVSSGNSWNHITYSSYWCGEKFHGGWTSPDEAYENKTHPGDGSGSEWRGLSSDPSPKPKSRPRGNPKVTRYVLMYDSTPLYVADTEKEVRSYIKRATPWWTDIKKVRFRSPEASKK